MSGSHVVIDDHLLLRILLGDEPDDLREPGTGVSTTGLWYHRLCRALGDDRVMGSMSRSLGDAGSDVAARVIRGVAALPESIGLVPLRTLAWPMAELIAGGTRLNLMSLETLAAAEHLGAEIVLAEVDENPSLVAAASRRGLRVRLIAD